MAAEVFALPPIFDYAFIIRHELQVISNQKPEMMMFTDSKQFLDVITKGSYTTKERLIVDGMVTSDPYKKNAISNVGLVSGTSNSADGLTNPTKCKSIYNILVKGKDYRPETQ